MRGMAKIMRASTAILALAALCCLTAPALADPLKGFYVSGGLAITQQADLDINGIDTAFGEQPGGYLSSDVGGGVNLAAGRAFGNGFRAELELSYRRASLDQATAGALVDATTDGTLQQTGFFLNGYYDFRAVEDGTFDGLTPYLGAGIGRVRVSWDDADSYNAVELVRHDSSDTATGAQLMVGVAYPVAHGGRTALTAELRHVRLLDDLSFNGRVVESRFGSFPIKTDVTDRGRTEIIVGLRHQF